MAHLIQDSIDSIYESMIHKTSIENLEIVTSGIVPPNPSELLHSSRMEKFMERVTKEYDVIYLDECHSLLPNHSRWLKQYKNDVNHERYLKRIIN